MSAAQPLILRCPACGAKNRIPADRIHDRPKCGKCKAALNPDQALGGKPVTATDANFQSEILASPLPVLLDCWAPWCGPCRMVGPIIDELAGEWRGRIKVAKLNTDENPQTAARFQIRSIPTMLVFHQGQLRDTLVGALPKKEIVKRMSAYLH